MGPDAAINIIFRNEIAKGKRATTEKRKLVKEYREKFSNRTLLLEEDTLTMLLSPQKQEKC